MGTRSRLWLAIAVLTVAYLVIARFALEAFPMSGDEYSYVLQGEIFAGGHLSVPAPPNAQLFEVDHVITDQVVRSKYPPGWPALLSLGWLVRAPWIVGPILAGLTLALLYATAEAFCGPRGALVAVLFLGCSPFFAINAASFHSHVSALLAGALYIYGLVKGVLSKSVAWGAVAGVGLGLLFLVRPADAAMYGLAAIALYPWPRTVIACVCTSAPIAALMLPYQAAQFGSPWTSGYGAYEPTFRALFGERSRAMPLSFRFLLQPAVQWWHLAMLFDLAAWLVPATMALALLDWIKPAQRGPMQRFFVSLAALPLLSLLVQPGDMGDAYGPRYLFPVLLPMAIAAATAWTRLEPWFAAHPALAAVPAARRTRCFALILAALIGCGIIRCGIWLEREHVEIVKRSRLYRQVADLGLDHAVVIVSAESPTFWARNHASFDGPVLYVSARGRSDREVARLFPDRVGYSARRPPGQAEWTIAPVLPHEQ
jgi:hypothetical protein